MTPLDSGKPAVNAAQCQHRWVYSFNGSAEYCTICRTPFAAWIEQLERRKKWRQARQRDQYSGLIVTARFLEIGAIIAGLALLGWNFWKEFVR